MNFLHDKHSRYYCIFIVTLVLLLFLMGIAVIDTQTAATKEMFLTHNNAIATSLLEEGISKEVIATALMNTEAGTTGNKFLAEIGLSNSTDIENLPYVSAVKNTILTSLFVMLFLWTLLLFLGTMLFLYRRERLYRESENIIKDYIDGNYTVHLPQSNEGTIYQLLSSVDQLATMLQAKNDTEQKTKEFLKNTISDISHQLKTPLSALMMYQEIIENEPENFETVKEFSLKIGTALTIDFMNHTLTPLQPWTADISVISPEDTCSVKAEFIEELQQNPAVKNVYGRMFAYNVPVIVNGEEKVVDLISYEDMQFDWAKDYVLSGSLEKAQSESNTGLIVFEPQNDIEVGNVITLNLNGSQADMEIVGMLSDCPFNNRQDVGKLICSEDTFRKLTGETDYSIIDIQLSQNATENDVNEIHRLVGSQYTFSDERMGNSNTRGAYYCFGLFIYGFLVLIALITLFNIINSIAMSVVAKMKQYGVFRAIGLSNRQLAKMIIAEASTYAITGTICGSVLGIVCNKILFSKLITYKWGDAWSVPLVQLGIIIVVVAIAVILAVRNPIKKLEKTSIVDIISVQ